MIRVGGREVDLHGAGIDRVCRLHGLYCGNSVRDGLDRCYCNHVRSTKEAPILQSNDLENLLPFPPAVVTE